MSERYILEGIKLDSKGRSKSSTIIGVYRTLEDVEKVTCGLGSNKRLKFNIQTDYTLFDHVNTPNYFSASSDVFTLGKGSNLKS
jgi:phenylalanyl-tRNA synthetase alpha subunit